MIEENCVKKEYVHLLSQLHHLTRVFKNVWKTKYGNGKYGCIARRKTPKFAPDRVSCLLMEVAQGGRFPGSAPASQTILSTDLPDSRNSVANINIWISFCGREEECQSSPTRLV